MGEFLWKIVGIFIMLATVVLLTISFTAAKPTVLGGAYQSEHVNGRMIQLSLDEDHNTFVYYIDSRLVEQGDFEQTDSATYVLKGKRDDYTLVLSEDNTFTVSIPQISDAPILLKHLNATPIYISTIYGDETKYRQLLD